MNIISNRTLVQFYKKHPQAKIPLEVWHQDAKKSEWKTPDDIGYLGTFGKNATKKFKDSLSFISQVPF